MSEFPKSHLHLFQGLAEDSFPLEAQWSLTCAPGEGRPTTPILTPPLTHAPPPSVTLVRRTYPNAGAWSGQGSALGLEHQDLREAAHGPPGFPAGAGEGRAGQTAHRCWVV